MEPHDWASYAARNANGRSAAEIFSARGIAKVIVSILQAAEGVDRDQVIVSWPRDVAETVGHAARLTDSTRGGGVPSYRRPWPHHQRRS